MTEVTAKPLGPVFESGVDPDPTALVSVWDLKTLVTQLAVGR